MEQEKKDLIKIVEPHKIMSRDVNFGDIKRVVDDAKKMYELIGTKIGNYEGFYAIAHCQVTREDPLRFFLANPQYDIFNKLPEAIIVNAKIVNHTKQIIMKEEGCLSYATLHPVQVERWNKCDVEYQVITEEGNISEVYKETLSSTLAQVFQHEIDHFNAKYIYKIK